MELTLENKAKFFAQYFDQDVAGIDQPGFKKDFTTVITGNTLESDSLKYYYLVLKPISSITDEDAKIARTIMHWPGKEIKSVSQTIVLLNINMFPMVLTDYLRSKGYALPWMGLSVDQMIEASWIKLKK